MKKYEYNCRLLSVFKIWIGILILVIVFQSCKLGPNYSRTLEIKQNSYRQDYPEGTTIANTPWWELFRDTTLTRLIRVALENNQDLKIANKRIEQSMIPMQIVRANLYPGINYAADASSTASTESSGLNNDASGIINISYQVDLWGRIRRLNEAALQEYLATEEVYRALTIVIVAEVANAYLTLRDLDNRLNISIQTADSWQANMEIVQARFNGGFVSEVDLNQAKIQLAEANTAIQTFSRLRTQTENAISILLGLPPQAIPRGDDLVQQVFPPDPPAGLPSELLDRRPDIMAAERRLKAQTERIGAAEALRYPSLTLSADMGMQFINPTLGFAALGAQVLGPIFNYGANKRQVEIEKVRTEQLLNDYEFTFINALREVEDAMIAVQTYENEFLLRRDQVLAAQEAARLSWVRYDGGLTSYLEVLDLQRSLFSSQLKASETLQLQLTSTVRLYQALGGGWIPGQDTVFMDRQ